MSFVELAISNSDPANLMLTALVWWRLDRRVRRLADRQEELHDPDHSKNN